MDDETALNTGTFEEMLAVVKSDLMAAARRKTYTIHDAEDLYQNAVTKAYRNFHSYEQGTNFRAWMLRVVANMAIDTYRHKSSRVSETYYETWHDNLQQAPDVAEIAFWTEIDSKLAAAIANIPDDQRNVLIALAIEQCTYQEAADRFGVPIGTIMSRYNRARTKVKKALQAA